MASNKTDDASLLARLNALRKSPISLSTTPAISSTTPDNLRDRFKGLRSRHSESGKDTETVPETISAKEIVSLGAGDGQDEDVADAVNELRSKKAIGKDEFSEADELLRDAKIAIDKSKDDSAPQNEENQGKEEAVEEKVDPEAPVTEDDIERLLAELELNRPSTDDRKEESENEDNTDDDDNGSAVLQLPDTPSQLKDPPRNQDSSFELPSVPSGPPTGIKGLQLPSVPKPGTKAQQPKDDDTENWCIICLDDATLKCVGCDGDLYCNNCWNEGHRSPDAGLEERSHRALAFSKGKKKKKLVAG